MRQQPPHAAHTYSPGSDRRKYREIDFERRQATIKKLNLYVLRTRREELHHSSKQAGGWAGLCVPPVCSSSPGSARLFLWRACSLAGWALPKRHGIRTPQKARRSEVRDNRLAPQVLLVLSPHRWHEPDDRAGVWRATARSLLKHCWPRVAWPLIGRKGEEETGYYAVCTPEAHTERRGPVDGRHACTCCYEGGWARLATGRRPSSSRKQGARKRALGGHTLSLASCTAGRAGRRPPTQRRADARAHTHGPWYIKYPE